MTLMPLYKFKGGIFVKNKKGATVVELIVSFTLVTVISIFLFQLVISLKELYDNSIIKTELLNKQSLISNQLNSTLNSKEIATISKCGLYCLNFNYTDGTTDRLVLDLTNKTFEFGTYKTDLPEDSYFANPNIAISYAATFNTYANNAMVIIDIPIYSDKIKDQNFGVKVIYQYNSNLNNLEIPDYSTS